MSRTLTAYQRMRHRACDVQPERRSVRECTAEMLGEAIVRIYRLSGWTPERVALELASRAPGCGRDDILRWARDGVPPEHRYELLWCAVPDLEERLQPAEHWGGGRVRRLRESLGWSRLDLAMELDRDVADIRAWERGEERPRQSLAGDLRGLERRAEQS